MKFKRCAYCGGRIWGTARLYVHMYGPELMLQCYTHDNGKGGRKACDQLLNETITRRYTEDLDMFWAVAPYLKFDTRATEGVVSLTEKGKPGEHCSHKSDGFCPSCAVAAEVAEQVRKHV